MTKNAKRILKGLEEAAAFAKGKAADGYRVHVPEAVDVKAIRIKLGLSQKGFADRYGFAVGAVRDWEQNRRRPETSARVLLKIIEAHPGIVDEVLGRAA